MAKNSWDCIPIEKWRALLASVLKDGDFETASAALDADLDPDQTAALHAWRKSVEDEAEAREFRGEVSRSSIAFMESLLNDIDGEAKESVRREIEIIKARSSR